MMPRIGARPWPVSGFVHVATLGGGGPLVRCLIWSSWTALFSLLTVGLVWYGWIPPRQSLPALLTAQAYYRCLAPWHWLLPGVPVVIWVVLWTGPIAWLHEWSHGALLWRFGQRRPVIRWRWCGWRGAHIAVRDRAFTRQAMLLILLTPLLVFMLGGLVLCWIIPPVWLGPLWLLVWANGLGAAADLYQWARLLPYPPTRGSMTPAWSCSSTAGLGLASPCFLDNGYEPKTSPAVYSLCQLPIPLPGPSRLRCGCAVTSLVPCLTTLHSGAAAPSCGTPPPRWSCRAPSGSLLYVVAAYDPL